MRWSSFALLLWLASLGCSGKHVGQQPPPVAQPCGFSLADVKLGSDTHALRVNEVMTGNDGAWVDGLGQTDDFIELVNTGKKSV